MPVTFPFNRDAKKKLHTMQFSVGIFFSIWVFFHKHSQLAEQQEKVETISWTSICHFHYVTGN